MRSPAKPERELVQQLEQEFDLGARMPVPLPSVWRHTYELSKDSPSLGGGAFAEVFKVRHRETNECFAVKVMHRPNFAMRGIEKQIDYEILAMRLAAEARQESDTEVHIVRLLDVAEEYDYVFLMLELCEHGDLLRMLHMEPLQRFSEEEGARWARQLLLGLRMVHNLGFIHRDIKLDNLLCTSQNLLKIGDFGWCSTIADAPTCLAGTFQYMAPEVLRNNPQTKAVDVWSAGVALHQILVGQPLLTTYLGPGATRLTECDPHRATAVKQRRLLEEIAATCPPSYDRRPLDLSPICWDFIRQLLIPDAKQRMTVESALRHPWLVKFSHGASTVELPLAYSHPEVEEASSSGGEPEETSRPRGRGRETAENSLSPVRGRQGTRSPASTRSGNSIENVPTPLKPRSWDPDRNIAYTPPVEGEDDDASNDHSTPEVSPERKARLSLSTHKVSALTLPAAPAAPAATSTTAAGANDICKEAAPIEHVEYSQTPRQRLSPSVPLPRMPQIIRPLGGSIAAPPVGSSVGVRPSPGRACDSPVVVLSGRTPVLRSQVRIDHQAANVLLRQLNNCNEQLRQLQSEMTHNDQRLREDSTRCVRSTPCLNPPATENHLTGSTGVSVNVLHSDRSGRSVLTASPRRCERDMHQAGVDILMATAPPMFGNTTPGVMAPVRVLDGSARVPLEGIPSASDRENIPANVVNASGQVAKPWKGHSVAVRGGGGGVVTYTAAARYSSPNSPLRTRNALSPSPATARTMQHVLVPVVPAMPAVTPAAAMWAQPTGAPPQALQQQANYPPEPLQPRANYPAEPLQPLQTRAPICVQGITRRRASAPGAWLQAKLA